MINTHILNEITQRIADSLPTSLHTLNENFQKNLRAIVTSVFEKFDLVTREEFEAHLRVLHRSLQKLEILEQKIAQFECESKQNQS
jgi:BMFP domain-containing protein YqiC